MFKKSWLLTLQQTQCYLGSQSSSKWSIKQQTEQWRLCSQLHNCKSMNTHSITTLVFHYTVCNETPFTQWVFSVVAPRVWTAYLSTLPIHSPYLPSKKHLKTHLFRQLLTWPVFCNLSFSFGLWQAKFVVLIIIVNKLHAALSTKLGQHWICVIISAFSVLIMILIFQS